MTTHGQLRETFIAACSQHPQFLQIRSLSAGELGSSAFSVAEDETSETSTLGSCSSTSMMRRASLGTPPSSIGDSASSLEIESLSVAETSIGADVSSTKPMITRTACRYDCYCACHIQSTSTMGVPRLRSRTGCTDQNCQAARSSKEPPTEPSRFFRQALSQILSSKSIRIRYDLSTFRMVSEGSDAMRYVKHGNLDKLISCIESGDATLWDTAPDGWSLLHVSWANDFCACCLCICRPQRTIDNCLLCDIFSDAVLILRLRTLGHGLMQLFSAK